MRKPTQQLGFILKMMGLSLTKVGTMKVAGRKVHRYRLDADMLEGMQAIVRTRAELKGWAFMAARYGAHMDPKERDAPEKPLEDFAEYDVQYERALAFVRGQRGDNREGR